MFRPVPGLSPNPIRSANTRNRSTKVVRSGQQSKQQKPKRCRLCEGKLDLRADRSDNCICDHLFPLKFLKTAVFRMKIYCEGKIIPESECSISTSDHGFLYGISLFETFRTFNGKPFLLEAHLRRMQASCNAFSFALHDRLLSTDPKGGNLQKILQQLLETNDLSDAVFRCTISSGQPSENPADPFYPNPREFIFVRPLPPPPPDAGIDLHILQTTRKLPEVFPRPKSGNFADNVLALQELQRRKPTPSAEGLLLTADGRLSERIHSNLFIIRDDGLDRKSTRLNSSHVAI